MMAKFLEENGYGFQGPGLKIAGFSIEGGTRRLIAAYFGIYSRLLCV